MAKTTDKLLDRTGQARPYVERALRDEDLRDNVRNAFESARSVYNELIGGRGAVTFATRVAGDKEIQAELKNAVEELREAAERIQGKKEHGGRNATLLLAGIALGILFNPVTGEQTRKWLSDTLFGSSDDFTYQGGGNSGAAPSAASSTATSSTSGSSSS
jgi:hypothetical protein